MITDLITVWPRNCDYPLWRQFIRDNRAKFNEIVIAFMETNAGLDYREFVKNAMFGDYVHFVDPQPIPPGDDWRNIATNAALLHSYNAPWIWFTEEDFYPREGFWDDVKRLEDEGCDVIAVYQGPRMHPCCIFVKREALNQTRKNFGIVPDQTDHFYLFQKDLENKVCKIGHLSPDKYYHYNGLSHNQHLAAQTGKPNYEVPVFLDWLKQCLNVTVPNDPRFVKLARAVIEGQNEQGVAPTTPPDHSPTP